ncbi:hypothetical protein EYF80_036203 [Liparis tanakae]|uniref:Uncharacterized protein n=1 Tax=Liparis tanakae TaxID=230148 RepID=A0A4Z2GK11_9TELE|nr:hypothetical protein EYF80_036203 [Liparis tanakae]
MTRVAMGSNGNNANASRHEEGRHLHGAGEAHVCDPRHHEDLVLVDSDAKQGAGRFQGSQVLPLELEKSSHYKHLVLLGHQAAVVLGNFCRLGDHKAFISHWVIGHSPRVADHKYQLQLKHPEARVVVEDTRQVPFVLLVLLLTSLSPLRPATFVLAGLWEKPPVSILDEIQLLLDVRAGLQILVMLHFLLEVIQRYEPETDAVQQLRQVLDSVRLVMSDPVHQGLKHLLLTFNVEGV